MEAKGWSVITDYARAADSLQYKYLLLAEFSVRTVNYGPSFFCIDLFALGP